MLPRPDESTPRSKGKRSSAVRRSSQASSAVRRSSQAARSELLYDTFLVVRPERGGDGAWAPKIVLQYPLAGTAGTAALPRDVELFCYPDIERTQAVASSDAAAGRSEEFTFVLTAEDGGRIFGFCRRSLPVGVGHRFDGGKRVPETLCFVGRRPYFSLFSTLLSVACSRRWLNPQALPSLLHAAREHAPFPLPGEVFALREAGVARQRQLRLLRPNEGEVDGADHADMRTLLTHLPPPQLILLISALMCERRIVVSSASLHVLSTAIHAAVALLQPFTWEHIFVPVLPAALLSYACAPMPFVVGVRADLMEELRELPLSGIVFVDLDAGTLYTTEDARDDDAVLPMCGTGGAADVAESTGYVDGGLNEARDEGKKQGGLRSLLGKVKEKAQNSVVEMGLGSATAGQLLCRDIVSISERTRAGDKPAYSPNKELQTAFVAFFLHIFGDHTLYCAAPPGGGEVAFDRELFLRRRAAMDASDPALGRFLKLFHGSQMFEVFAGATMKRLKEQAEGFGRKLSGGGLFVRAISMLGTGGVVKDFTVGSVRKVLRRMQASETADASQPVRDLVLALTSNTPLKETPGRTQWDLLVQLAEQLADARHFHATITLMKMRVSDSSGWQWRHGVKACELLGTLLSMPGAPEALLPAALDAAPEMRRLMARESELAGKVPGFPADAPLRVRRAARCVHMLSHDWAKLQRARRFCGRLERPPFSLPSGQAVLGRLVRSMPLHADTADEAAAVAAAAGSCADGRANESVHAHRRRMRCFACSFGALHARLRPPQMAPVTAVPEASRQQRARLKVPAAVAPTAQLVDMFGGFGFGNDDDGGGGCGGAPASVTPAPGSGCSASQDQGTWSAFDFDSTPAPSTADDGFGDAFSAAAASSPGGGGGGDDGFGDSFSAATAAATPGDVTCDDFGDTFGAPAAASLLAPAASDGFGNAFSVAPTATASPAPRGSDGFGDVSNPPAATSPTTPAAAAVADGFGDAFDALRTDSGLGDDGFGDLGATATAAVPAPAQNDMWAGLDLTAAAAPMAPTTTLARATSHQPSMISGSADPFALLAGGQQAAFGGAQRPMQPAMQPAMQPHSEGQQQQQQQQQQGQNSDPFAALSTF